ncbi:hypothetical protein, partial [Lacimonas salitolerans]
MSRFFCGIGWPGALGWLKIYMTIFVGYGKPGKMPCNNDGKPDRSGLVLQLRIMASLSMCDGGSDLMLASPPR